MIYFALTWDYELFFNDWYTTADKILIDPAEKITQLCNKLDIPSTFFIDTCMIQRFQEVGYNELINIINEQIKKIAGNGMCIGLHQHPIWLTADYRAGKWFFNPSDYMFDAFKEKDIRDSLRFGCDYITNILGYKELRAFRAGGFSFSPYRILYEELWNNGIRIDSSVFRYGNLRGMNQSYDFTVTPKKMYWYINRDSLKCVNQVSDGILELPVAGTKKFRHKLEMVEYRRKKLSKVRPKGKGSDVIYSNPMIQFIEKYRKKFIDYSMPLSFDSLEVDTLISVTREYLSKYNEKELFVVGIGHPKFQSEFTFNTLERFIRKVRDIEDVSFVSINEMANKIEKV